MDGRKQIIDKIEHYYQSYLNRQSDVLFNASTDELLDFVLNVTICKNIVSYVKELYPISNELLEKNQNTEYFNYANDITRSKEYYISYCLHWFDYIKANFQYSVLENYNARMDDNYILSREKWWKDTLCTKQFGYNKN